MPAYKVDKSAEREKEEIDAYNQAALDELLQTWSMNIADNLAEARQSPDVREALASDGHRHYSDAVVIGAAPNLRWEDLDALHGFKGQVFCCNKSVKMCLANGVVPDYIMLVDSNPISREQFTDLRIHQEPITEETFRNTSFLVSTSVSPYTIKYLKEVVKARIFMFNPYTESGGKVPISTTWKWMNEKEVIETGGSVGTFGFKVAKMQGHYRIGLLGFQFYETPDPSWSKERVREYEIFYYPDANAYAAMNRGYKSYLTFINEEIRGEMLEVANLSRGLVLDRCPFMKSMSVQDFVGYKK